MAIGLQSVHRPAGRRALVPRLAAALSSARFWWALGLAWVVVSAWVGRHAMGPDGMSYLDMARETLTSGPHALVNANWSPAYSALLAAALAAVRPSPALEFTLVHALNLVIFVAVLAAFTFFLRQWLASERAGEPAETAPAMRIIGFAAMLWAVPEFVGVRLVSPDLLVAGAVFGTAGLVARLSRPDAGTRHAIALGLALGLGYYVKAALLPAGLALLTVLWCVPPEPGTSRRRIALAAAVFALTALPLIAALSVQQGRLTAGETARHVALSEFNGLPYTGWTGGEGVRGTPSHAPRVIAERPRTLEFATPVAGTYPLWYDPTYWLAGATPTWSATRARAALARHMEVFRTAAGRMSGLLVCLLGFAIAAAWRGARLLPGRRDVWLCAWATMGLGMYAVLYAEYRYIAPFVVLLILGASRRIIAGAGPAARNPLVVLSVGVMLWSFVSGTVKEVLDPPQQGPAALVTARALESLGLRPGDRVAWVGSAMDAYGPHLGRFRIAAQVEDANAFQQATSAERDEVLTRLRQIDVRAVASTALAPPTAEWVSVVLPDGRSLCLLKLR